MADDIIVSKELADVLKKSINYAGMHRHEFVTPEHILYFALDTAPLQNAIAGLNGKKNALEEMKEALKGFLEELEIVPEEFYTQPVFSDQAHELLEEASETAIYSNREEIELQHLLSHVFELSDSRAAYELKKASCNNKGEFLAQLGESSHHPAGTDDSEESGNENGEEEWKSLVVCLNDIADEMNPLIGREEELERTIRTLCRKQKNNPLHVGEPGVGKTALVYGLARLINEGNVPETLRGSRIYLMNMGSVIAGAQMRGEFEERLKKIMQGASGEKNAIIYIDEIHTIVGAGSSGQGSLDASNILKPYLEDGKLRFIGATTYDEYKRYFEHNRSLARRFQKIDIAEPSEEEALKIVTQLSPIYESHHGVTYAPDALEFAVRGSARHLHERYLPDKAIDLIDEAGAYRQLHPLTDGSKRVEKSLISDLLAQICKVERLAETTEDDGSGLNDLAERILSQVYGQDEAVKVVTESVLMAKAGLSDETKPLASLLFVGPTGVGKTEVAKVLAKQLGVELVRFDMSEYSDRFTVSKLIGAPAGYVGYDDGGLLTDAVRKHPDCVLLLDEIEKAHPDIYNILLQVMDYGRLTDNRGNRADFRNVVLIMTSNAGAQYASQTRMGFGNTATTGEGMMRQVKKTFKPEFLNRLTATVIFNDMDLHMARLILKKKLLALSDKLAAKRVTLRLTPEAEEWLLRKGVTREYGAREIERVLTGTLNPLLMRAILFGSLKNGGEAEVEVREGVLSLAAVRPEGPSD
ncbi:MAG: ATP-dependent Clp protease ATP-binding subunit [Muribaculaceae bacterium]|nr:ATP-dependent Clp protease ATP-binding subunit [Muribaculaceae bacterium]